MKNCGKMDVFDWTGPDYGDVVVWWCFCGAVVVFLWCCFCGGVVFLWWCGGVIKDCHQTSPKVLLK